MENAKIQIRLFLVIFKQYEYRENTTRKGNSISELCKMKSDFQFSFSGKGQGIAGKVEIVRHDEME